MKVGTDSGVWFSYYVQPDGLFNWEIYLHDVVVDMGVTSESEFYQRFVALDTAAKLPLQ